MFATFKCNFCGKKVTSDFSKANDFPNNCPKCNSPFSNPHYIPDFGEKVYNFQRALGNLTFCGLSDESPDIVFESDLDSLENLHIHSSSEVKKILTRILDLNFLIIYHDAKDENIEKLNNYISKLELIHKNKTNIKNKNIIDLFDTLDD